MVVAGGTLEAGLPFAAEAAIVGKPINEANAEAAGSAAVADAKPLPATTYKVQIAEVLVKRTLLAIA